MLEYCSVLSSLLAADSMLSAFVTSLPRSDFAFDSIEEAIEAIRNGEFVVVLDNEDRENEGDLIAAASTMTPEKMAFMIRHTRCESPFISKATRLSLHRGQTRQSMFCDCLSHVLP
jgi:hypothetical protein